MSIRYMVIPCRLKQSDPELISMYNLAKRTQQATKPGKSIHQHDESDEVQAFI